MAGETQLTIVGNLTADPELRFTPNGAAVANFTIASTPRTFDRQSNQWVDGEALFMRCSLWKEAAENVAESLQKGMRVIASGRIKQRSFQDRDGNNRTVIEMDVYEIGPSLNFATARVTRVDRRNGQPGGQPGGAPQGGEWGQGAPQGGEWGQGAPQPPAWNNGQPGGQPGGQTGGQQQGQQQGGDPWPGQPSGQGGNGQWAGWSA